MYFRPHGLASLVHLSRSMATNSATRKALATENEIAGIVKSGWTVLSTPRPPSTTAVDSDLPQPIHEQRPPQDLGTNFEQRFHRDFKFNNFEQAWGFMTRVAFVAEKLSVRMVSM